MRVLLALTALPRSVATTPPPLFAWLATCGTEESIPIELRASCCGDGIGAFLTRPMQAGEVVFAIPASSFISLSTALNHPTLGAVFQQLWDSSSDGGVALLAGLVAHLQLNGGEPHAYLSMLPSSLATQNSVLWWTDDEVALLAGTSAHDEAISLRAEADEAIDLLKNTALSADVALHGEAAVADAMRAALVGVLSRAYAVLGEGGRPCKTLVPLLDAINHHSAAPTIDYLFTGAPGDEGGGAGAGLLIARSLCDQPAGAELLVSYGEQPDLLFGLHYGFVPPPDYEARTLAEEVEAVRDELLAEAAAAVRESPLGTSEGRGANADALRAAAFMRLEAIKRGAERARDTAGGRSVRACSASLALALRQSEKRVLQHGALMAARRLGREGRFLFVDLY